jgi:pimeloyl-ACP methyl ester carboxylesterase
MQRARRVFLIAIVAIILLYAGICGLVFAFQRSLIYYPQPRTNSEAGTLITFRVGTETVNVSSRPFASPDAVLYFGGNGEDVSRDMPDMEDAFPHRAIYLLHYPGYGGSSGSPSQQGIFADALALYDRVHAGHPNIVVIGRSLGSGVAVWIASQRPVARLVLITPYDSLVDPAVQQYPFLPVRWLLRDKFESWKYAPRVTAPTRMIVAEDDEIIPRSSSERLRTRFKGNVVSYVVVPGAGHNTIQDSANYWTLLSSE